MVFSPLVLVLRGLGIGIGIEGQNFDSIGIGIGIEGPSIDFWYWYWYWYCNPCLKVQVKRLSIESSDRKFCAENLTHLQSPVFGKKIEPLIPFHSRLSVAFQHQVP